MTLVTDRRLLLIEWLDSKGVTYQWEYLDELEPIKPDRVLSIGFLLDEADDYVTIAQSVSKTQVLGRTTIPRCSIQMLVELDAGYRTMPA